MTDLDESFLGDHDHDDVVHTSTTSTLLEVHTLEEEYFQDSSLPSSLLVDVTSMEVTTIEENIFLSSSMDDDTTEDYSSLYKKIHWTLSCLLHICLLLHFYLKTL